MSFDTWDTCQKGSTVKISKNRRKTGEMLEKESGRRNGQKQESPSQNRRVGRYVVYQKNTVFKGSGSVYTVGYVQ